MHLQFLVTITTKFVKNVRAAALFRELVSKKTNIFRVQQIYDDLN